MRPEGLNLPEVSRVSKLISGEVLSKQVQGGAIHITGNATVGKTAVLRRVSEEISSSDPSKITVFLDPPNRALDSGNIALLQIGAAFKRSGLINGGFKQLLEPERKWADKIRIVHDWIRSAEGRAVFLCDEPAQWPSVAGDDLHFGQRAKDVISLVLGQESCAKVVAGELPEGYKISTTQVLKARSNPTHWLKDKDYWGELSEAAESLLQGNPIAALENRSPLELRLLVGVAALERECHKQVSSITELSGRRRISTCLSELLPTEKRSSFFRLWGALSLNRVPFTDDLLTRLGFSKLGTFVGAVFRKCLLFEEGEFLILHDILKKDAVENHRWLSEEQVADEHRVIAEYFLSRFEALENSNDASLGTAVLANAEAYHHASASRDPSFVKEMAPYFVDQLNIFGRALSYHLGRWKDAAEVFAQAVKWDPTDDYAVHYLGYNRDILADDPIDVEKQYRKALEINDRNPRWHSHWIQFLVTRGRVEEADEAFNKALDALDLPRDDVDPNVFENLHVPVASLLIHRGELDFARRVMDLIRSRDQRIAVLRRRLDTLIETQRYGAYVPGDRLTQDWKERGPFLFEPEFRSAGLDSWIAARVEDVDGPRVYLRTAHIQRANGKASAVFGTSEISVPAARKWSDPTIARALLPGTFVEIAIYRKAGKNSKPITRLKVHPRRPWSESDLFRIFPDPTRYLKKKA